MGKLIISLIKSTIKRFKLSSEISKVILTNFSHFVCKLKWLPKSYKNELQHLRNGIADKYSKVSNNIVLLVRRVRVIVLLYCIMNLRVDDRSS